MPMTVNSKFKPYGIFALVLSVFLYLGICFFIYLLASTFFLGGHTVPRGTLPASGGAVFIIIFAFLSFAILRSWLLYAFNIEINPEEQTIVFRNVITRSTTSYSFADFDGYLETYTIAKGGNYKVLYLMTICKRHLNGLLCDQLGKMAIINMASHPRFDPTAAVLSSFYLHRPTV